MAAATTHPRQIALGQARVDTSRTIRFKARSDGAPAVHRRWREGAQQSDPKHLRCGRRHPALPWLRKGRNIIEPLPEHLHASVKKALGQAWEQDDAEKAERLLRNLVRRLEQIEPGVAGSILEEILTVIRLGPPQELRRSVACTNIIENALGTVRQVTRNIKRWRNAEMAFKWTAAGLQEAQKTFSSPQGLYPPAAHPSKRSPGAHAKGSGRLGH